MLKQRILTALVLAPLMLAGIFWLPEIGFRLFIAVIVMLGAWEWANIAGFKSMGARIEVAIAFGLIVMLIHLFLDVNSSHWTLIIFACLFGWLFAALAVIKYPAGKVWYQSRILLLSVMIPVLGATWMGLVWLKVQSNAAVLLTWLMLLVWGADVGAYFAGRIFGQRKLAPNVSPGKTWAGVYGGMATSIIISVVIAYVFLPDLTVTKWIWLIVLSVSVIAISVIGDLFESLLKRNSGIKDSSQLLPGHGGILDRIDSLCSATPMFVLLWYILDITS